MIARLARTRLRLVDAVAVAVLALKATSFLAADPAPQGAQARPSGVGAASEQLPFLLPGDRQCPHQLRAA